MEIYFYFIDIIERKGFCQYVYIHCMFVCWMTDSLFENYTQEQALILLMFFFFIYNEVNRTCIIFIKISGNFFLLKGNMAGELQKSDKLQKNEVLLILRVLRRHKFQMVIDKILFLCHVFLVSVVQYKYSCNTHSNQQQQTPRCTQRLPKKCVLIFFFRVYKITLVLLISKYTYKTKLIIDG